MTVADELAACEASYVRISSATVIATESPRPGQVRRRRCSAGHTSGGLGIGFNPGDGDNPGHRANPCDGGDGDDPDDGDNPGHRATVGDNPDIL